MENSFGRQIRFLQVCVGVLTVTVSVLIGAPIPAAKNRVRTDLERVKGIWGKLMPPTYINAYKTYENSMNGILVLDANGFDRVAMGDPAPDPNIGRRNAPVTGIVTNDSQGFERTGYGVHTIDGRDQPMLWMDYVDAEALILAVTDNGPRSRAAGITISNNDRHLYVGSGDGALMNIPGGERPFNGWPFSRASR